MWLYKDIVIIGKEKKTEKTKKYKRNILLENIGVRRFLNTHTNALNRRRKNKNKKQICYKNKEIYNVLDQNDFLKLNSKPSVLDIQFVSCAFFFGFFYKIKFLQYIYLM